MKVHFVLQASCALMLFIAPQCRGTETDWEQVGHPKTVACQKTVAGVWSATQHDLPFVRLTVRERDGKLSGSIVLYVLRMEDGAWKTQGEEKLELVDPRVEGDEFVFELPHAKKDGSTDPADQEIKSFRLKLLENDKAQYKNAADNLDLVLTRRDE